MKNAIFDYFITKGLNSLFDKIGKATDDRGLRKRVEGYSSRYFQDHYAHFPMTEEFDYQGLHDFLMGELTEGVAACFDAPSLRKCSFSRDQLIVRAYVAAAADTKDKKRGAEAYVSLVLGIIETHFLEQCDGKFLFLANRQTAEILESVANMLNSMKAELEAFLDRYGSFAEFIDSVRVPVVNKLDYHYLNPNIGFVRRDKEFDYLDSFLDAPGSLLSSAVTGPGGIGKSKLMHQYMLERQYDLEWKTVFLNQAQVLKLSEFREWNYPKNLLIIIDYAGERAREIGQWLQELCSSTSLPQKLRIILLERQGLLKLGSDQNVEPIWYQQLAEASGHAAREILYQDRFHPLPVMVKQEMIDMIDMVAENHRAVTQAEKEHICCTASQFAKGDEDYRFNTPLFAILLTDALLNNKSLEKLSAQSLMDYVIVKLKNNWRTVLCGNDPSLFDSLERVLVFITAVGGWDMRPLPPPLKEDTIRILNNFNADALPMLSAAIAEDDGEHEELAPLKPDIIGEYFVLDYMHRHHTMPCYDQVLHLMWQEPYEFASFLNRCISSYLRDFPKLIFGEYSLLTDDANPFLRSVLLVNLTAFMDLDVATKAAAMLEVLYHGSGCNTEIALRYAQGLVNLSIKQDAAEAEGTIERLDSLRKEWPDSEEIALRYAQGLVILSIKQDAVEAEGTIERLDSPRREYPGSEEIALWYAQGLVSLSIKQDAAKTEGTIERLDSLRREYPGNEEIALRYAQVLVNLTFEQDAAEAGGTIERLDSLHREYPGNEEIALRYAQGLVILSIKQDAAEAGGTIERLVSLHREYPGSKEIALEYAKGLVSLSTKQDAAEAEGTIERLDSLRRES